MTQCEPENQIHVYEWKMCGESFMLSEPMIKLRQLVGLFVNLGFQNIPFGHVCPLSMLVTDGRQLLIGKHYVDIQFSLHKH